MKGYITNFEGREGHNELLFHLLYIIGRESINYGEGRMWWSRRTALGCDNPNAFYMGVDLPNLKVSFIFENKLLKYLEKQKHYCIEQECSPQSEERSYKEQFNELIKNIH